MCISCAAGTAASTPAGRTIWTPALRRHRSGRGAKYTRSHLPVELAYCEEHETKEAAMSREWQIKRLTRQQKLALIEKK